MFPQRLLRSKHLTEKGLKLCVKTDSAAFFVELFAAGSRSLIGFRCRSPSGATLSMRSLVKEEPDWRTGIVAGDRVGAVGGGPLRLRRGSRFTWRKECQSIMER